MNFNSGRDVTKKINFEYSWKIRIITHSNLAIAKGHSTQERIVTLPWDYILTSTPDMNKKGKFGTPLKNIRTTYPSNLASAKGPLRTERMCINIWSIWTIMITDPPAKHLKHTQDVTPKIEIWIPLKNKNNIFIPTWPVPKGHSAQEKIGINIWSIWPGYQLDIYMKCYAKTTAWKLEQFNMECYTKWLCAIYESKWYMKGYTTRLCANKSKWLHEVLRYTTVQTRESDAWSATLNRSVETRASKCNTSCIPYLLKLAHGRLA